MLPCAVDYLGKYKVNLDEHLLLINNEQIELKLLVTAVCVVLSIHVN
jgi:hypothetical protein